jgi:hypothetical protein
MDLSSCLRQAHSVVGRPFVLELTPRRDQFRVSSVRAAEDEVACISLPAARYIEHNLVPVSASHKSKALTTKSSRSFLCLISNFDNPNVSWSSSHHVHRKVRIR